jgi:exosortase/archaeosortase
MAATSDALKTPPALTELPWLQVAVGVAIAAFGGVTATLGRYLAASYAQTTFLWKLETVRDVFVSCTVGAGAYFAGSSYHVSSSAIALLLLISGYLGVRLLGAAADRLLGIVRGAPPPA